MYRSKFEKTFGDRFKSLKYEPFALEYVQVKNYLPDFVNEAKKIVFECKGYFRTSQEAKKYLDVRKANPEWEIIFVFANPDVALPWSKRRTGDGKRMNHKEWAEKNGFKWCTVHTVKKEWL